MLSSSSFVFTNFFDLQKSPIFSATNAQSLGRWIPVQPTRRLRPPNELVRIPDEFRWIRKHGQLGFISGCSSPTKQTWRNDHWRKPFRTFVDGWSRALWTPSWGRRRRIHGSWTRRLQSAYQFCLVYLISCSVCLEHTAKSCENSRPSASLKIPGNFVYILAKQRRTPFILTIFFLLFLKLFSLMNSNLS